MKRYNSRSDVQQAIEKEMFEKIKDILNDSALEEGKKLPLGEDGKNFICPDFYSEENKIIGEIHAHIGRLKGAQPDKIASDILKMLFYEKVNGGNWRKYIAVCDKEEYEQLTGKSFLAKVIREYDIKLLPVELSSDTLSKLFEAMKRQNLMT